jgi:hypothetical protein
MIFAQVITRLEPSYLKAWLGLAWGWLEFWLSSARAAHAELYFKLQLDNFYISYCKTLLDQLLELFFSLIIKIFIVHTSLQNAFHFIDF